jgi:hypothetical protein
MTPGSPAEPLATRIEDHQGGLPVREEEAHDLVSFTRIIAQQADSAGEQFWFRGCSDSRYRLVPSLFRHPSVSAIEQLLEMEIRLLTRFKQRSVPFLQAGLPTTDWDCLFLMQHFGVPTRLLDWSENAQVGLWFALKPGIDLGGDDTESAVWMLDPVSWNRRMLAFQSYKGGVLSPGVDVQLDGYAPGARRDVMNVAPAALYGTHNSPRIVAQRGVFTIAGKDTKPLEEFADTGDHSELTRILIPAPSRKSMLEELRRMGVTESMIYPDLQGLAQELQAIEGFR